MRLAISNIAWDVSEDEPISRLLEQYKIDAIDVAPGKYFPDPLQANLKEVKLVREWWESRGIKIVGMQALLFGSTGLNVFGESKVQRAMLERLAAVCAIAAVLGATRLVFGSPKNRDRSGLSDHEADAIAVPFFERLGDIAKAEGVTVCLEPNPPCYGANYMMTTAQTAQVVRLVGHASIKLQLDTGALTINHEDVVTELIGNAQLVGHVHASEPDLLPLGDGATNHTMISAALRRYLPNQVVSIEMLATSKEAHCLSIERALKVATESYRVASN